MKIAAVNWKVRPCGGMGDFIGHSREILELCPDADLVVMPENTSLELLQSRQSQGPWEEIDFLCSIVDEIAEAASMLAREHSCCLLFGTHFRSSAGGTVHSVMVADKDGRTTTEPSKVLLTQFETHVWRLTPGKGLCLLDGGAGITVCYDCEMPESGRALAEAGCLIQLVPAYTESLHGFWRVRNSCLARAIENQNIVVHASLVGSIGREPLVNARGSSAVIGPSIEPFPAGGILAETAFDTEGVAFAEIDLSDVHSARNCGDVRNWEDRSKGDWTVRRI